MNSTTDNIQMAPRYSVRGKLLIYIGMGVLFVVSVTLGSLGFLAAMREETEMPGLGAMMMAVGWVISLVPSFFVGFFSALWITKRSQNPKHYLIGGAIGIVLYSFLLYYAFYIEESGFHSPVFTLLIPLFLMAVAIIFFAPFVVTIQGFGAGLFLVWLGKKLKARFGAKIAVAVVGILLLPMFLPIMADIVLATYSPLSRCHYSRWGYDVCYANTLKDMHPDIVKKRSPDECENKLSNVPSIDACYKTFAKAHENIFLCDKIQGDFALSRCYGEVTPIVAAAEKDITLCADIPDTLGKDLCYQTIAEAEGDISVCDGILDLYQRDVCYQNVVKLKGILIPEQCYTIEIGNPRFRRGCYHHMVEIPDPLSIAKACNGFPEAYQRDACYFDIAIGVLTDTVLREGDPRVCDKISDAVRRDYCHYVIAHRKNNSALCDAIQDSKRRQSCFEQIEEIEEPQRAAALDACFEISDSLEKSICYRNIAWDTQDVSICDEHVENEENIFQKDNCYLGIIDRARMYDISLCNKIVSDFNKDICYWKIAEGKEEASFCEQVMSSTAQEQCYYNVAVLRSDQSICAKIENERKKYDCHSSIATDS